jgi:hypothetical protein
VKKPVDTWRDNDFEPFYAAATDAAQRLFALEALVASGLAQRSDANALGRGGVVLTLVRGNGSAMRRVVPEAEANNSHLVSKYAPLLGLSTADRAALCAMLLNSLEESASS